MDMIPTLVDGAVVSNIHNDCSYKSLDCSECSDLAIKLHNWLVQNELEYLVLDLQDEKEICPGFLQELLQLRKRIRIPFLFSGVMSQPRKYLEAFNYGDVFPIFHTPEDAIRALRMQYPGVTEGMPKTGLKLGVPISRVMEESLAV